MTGPGAWQAPTSTRPACSFSAPLADALAKVLPGYDAQSLGSDEALRMVILAAAGEARAAAWLPEELIAALDDAIAQSECSAELREQLHALLTRRALIAFFGAHESSN
jgi:hypothetical protein